MWLGVWSTSDDLQHFTRTTTAIMAMESIITMATTPPTAPPIIGPKSMGGLGDVAVGVARGVADEGVGSVEQTRTANSHMM